MTKQALPAVSVLSSETLEEFKTADKVVLVAFFEADDKASNATYSGVAESMRDDYLFGATNDATVAEAEGIKRPGIVLYKSFDEGKTTFQEKFDKEAISTFAKTAATPLVGEVGPDTYAGYMAVCLMSLMDLYSMLIPVQAGLPLAYIFAETPEERAELAETLKPVAQKHKGKVNLAVIDAKSFGAHAGNLNLEVDKWPAFAIQETVKNQKFPLDQSKKLTEKEVGDFVQNFVDGKIKPSIKSEPIPEKQDGPVKVIVAHNYEDVVMEADKDVLVEFYAPWCGHCKAYVSSPPFPTGLRNHIKLTDRFPQSRPQVRRACVHVHHQPRPLLQSRHRQGRRHSQRRPGRDPRLPHHQALPRRRQRQPDPLLRLPHHRRPRRVHQGERQVQG